MGNELELDRQVCFALYSASRATTGTYRAMLDRLGVTYPQYLVLLVLWEEDGIGVRDIGGRLHLDSGTLSPLLKRLESLELVERRRVGSDERRVHIHLTKSGSELRERATDIPAAIAEATGLSSSEMTFLRDVLNRVTASLRDAH
ncbi:MarR family winged helix-turn-helix transcriptional regulator [Rhodococcus sp. NPDC058521]|uniref:MarR family winged helix-turn-helix transcriptional regulator n=1 Tax=Rhodococcus sp. NPDC058521 TaxID=3346536 RepID=UPI0036479C3E